MQAISVLIISFMAFGLITCGEEMSQSPMSVWCYDCNSKTTPSCTGFGGHRIKMCELPFCIADVQGEDANASVVRRCATENEAKRYANALPPYDSDRGMSLVTCEKVQEQGNSLRRCVCVSNACTLESVENLLKKNLTILNPPATVG